MCFNHVVMKVNSMLLPIKIIFVLGKEDVDEKSDLKVENEEKDKPGKTPFLLILVFIV